MSSLLLCVVTKRRSLVSCRRFGTTDRSHLRGSRILEDGTDGFPETSATNYQSTLRIIPEGRGSQGQVVAVPHETHCLISVTFCDLSNSDSPCVSNI